MSSLQIPSTTTTLFPDPDPEIETCDGYVTINQSGSIAWSTLRSMAGNQFNDTTAVNIVVWLVTGNNTDRWRALLRSIYIFNTSTITTGDAVVSGTFSLYSRTTSNSTTNPSLAIGEYTGSATTGLAASDFDNVNWNFTKMSDTTVNGDTWRDTSNIYYNFPLNTAGINAVDIGSLTKLGFMLEDDLTNTQPTWGGAFEEDLMKAAHAENSGTSQDPKLVVTHGSPVEKILRIT